MWNSLRDEKKEDVHRQTGEGVECIIKNSLFRKSLDNVTIVIITFQNFQRVFEGEEVKLSENSTSTAEKSKKSEKIDVKPKQTSAFKKKVAHTKTFHQKAGIFKDLNKHRRVDSGGKKAHAKVLEHISKRKRTNSQKDSRNMSPDTNTRFSIGQTSKVKFHCLNTLQQKQASKFNQHFNNSTDSSKKVPTSKLASSLYKRPREK